MKPARVVAIVFGSIAAIIGFGLFAGAGRLGWAIVAERDSQGFFSSPTDRYTTSSYAITSQRIDLTDIGSRDWWVRRNVASVKVSALTPTKSEVFVGIAPVRDVEAYLAGVPHDEISNVRFKPFVATYRAQHSDGKTIPTPPATQKFWVASSSGSGTQAVRWKVEPGDWAVVVMNADGSRSVTADINAGLKIGAIAPIAGILAAVGAAFMAIGAALIFGGSRGAAAATVGTPEHGAAVVDLTSGVTSRGTPVHVEGQLDPNLSRWLWIIKPILAIPHFIILVFLWIGFAVSTMVAFFAILFTGRYPRSLFNFNVGVLRWSWRVGFYTTGVMGSDRYPPFSLDADGYPATFDIEYPQRLSRGLIFVKWFLALPHLIIVGVLTATWQTQNNANSGWRYGFNGGVLGLLAVVAGIVLLFSGKYPKGLFDFLMGCNRWMYRTIAYVCLMTDDYPPFRLDQGPSEPHTIGTRPWSPAPTSGLATTTSDHSPTAPVSTSDNESKVPHHV